MGQIKSRHKKFVAIFPNNEKYAQVIGGDRFVFQVQISEGELNGVIALATFEMLPPSLASA